jgi:hypothetical protein
MLMKMLEGKVMSVFKQPANLEDILTFTMTSISSVPCFALTGKVSWFINTDGINITGMSSSAALVDVHTHS